MRNPDKINRIAQLIPVQLVYSLSQELINYICCVCYTVTFDWYRWYSWLKAAKRLKWDGSFSVEFWVILQIIFLARAATWFVITLSLILTPEDWRQKESVILPTIMYHTKENSCWNFYLSVYVGMLYTHLQIWSQNRHLKRVNLWTTEC